MTKEILDQYRKDIATESDPIKRALYYFAINRSSFSGATFSGGFSQEAIKKRFTSSSVDRLENIDLSLCDFSNMDYREFLGNVPNGKGHFIYADPPYHLEKGSKLYGTKGDLHMVFSHDDFFKCMDAITTVPWIISYNDCSYVREKYSKYQVESVQWAYGMSKDKRSREILIFGGSLVT